MTEKPVGTARRCPLHENAVPLYEYAAEADRGRIWESLRDRFGQVAPVELEPGLVAWLLLGYEENLEVMRDWNTFSRDTRRWNEIRDGRRRIDETLPPAMSYRASALYADGAEHTRLITPVKDALTRLTESRIRRDIEETADQLIDGFCESGRADLVGEYAFLLPALLVNRFFGLEDTYGYILGDIMGRIWSTDGSSGAEAVQQLGSYFSGLVQRKKAAPGEDLTSWMLAHPTGLTDKEVVDQLILMSGAGHEPTTNLLGNVLHTMLTNPEIAREHASGGLPLEDIINHVLWAEPPMQLVAARFPTRDVDIDGTRVQEGEPLIIGFAPAHRDPRLGDTASVPDLPVPSGHNSSHLMWGAGEHRCPAQPIALLIVRIGVERLAARIPGITLAVDAGELSWRPEVKSRGLKDLPVHFDPVPARPAPAPRTPEADKSEQIQGASDAADPLTRLLRWWLGKSKGRRRRR
ncbi:MAG: cytochrome P450 [Nocardiopsaceae bacterium]|nr:cytochrome P450 [Nocardiopsaceae bacterium]